MMDFGADTRFTLLYPGLPAAALAWAQAADRALSQVEFLQDIRLEGDLLSGQLRVPVPLLGDITLPFCSCLERRAHGAALTPQVLVGRRGWVEVRGLAEVGPAQEDGTPVTLDFDFRAHLSLPQSGNRGGAAFEKMVRATAQRTTERVLAQLPEQLHRSMSPAPPSAP